VGDIVAPVLVILNAYPCTLQNCIPIDSKAMNFDFMCCLFPESISVVFLQPHGSSDTFIFVPSTMLPPWAMAVTNMRSEKLAEDAEQSKHSKYQN